MFLSLFTVKPSARHALLRYVFLLVLILVIPRPCFAYIGPGAGFAFLGSTAVFFFTILLSILTIFLWPITWAWRKLRQKGIGKGAKTRRVVIVGLDGLDPKVAERLMAEGRMPNLSALAKDGCYSRLGTTLPALSPVAWSTFQTGVNPGAHNIFDFLTRDKRLCLPHLSSTTTTESTKSYGIGPFKIRRTRSAVTLLRKSQPFWKLLGERGIFSNILRVPISYPPEKFNGNILSAMCTPDLKGTQGSFSFFTTREDKAAKTGGEFKLLKRDNGYLSGEIEGPLHPTTHKPIAVKFTLHPIQNGEFDLKIQDNVFRLKLDRFSDWVEIDFQFARRKAATGICRFCLREAGAETSLYVSPINIHPGKPVLPIAAPIIFANWLAQKIGLYGTLGLMEDTWGRNELALDDARFLEQSYAAHDERERMFLDTLERTREGLCVCVFDASDRIQHMFWRYMESDHPSPLEDVAKFGDTIPAMYERMDTLIGKVMPRLNPNDVLFVISDHGFAPFKRGINLNTWLYENGYLALKEGAVFGKDYLADVDWSKTRAFAIGLTGIFLNRKGREYQGIVAPDQVNALKREISEKLEQIIDPKNNQRAVKKVYDTAQSYKGVYAAEAPDLIVGYYPGYRVSWDSITGMLEKEVFSDNVKAWSGDHHVDPELVPGVIFCNRKMVREDPNLLDLAPTVLDLFAVPIPKYMEGRVVV